ncbi:ornithine cyclodeaminase family protein [Fimbriiglobus ruber]|uniref:Ornithine cyclodeaminase n=1 Tax=Fimbriiglobus ruber TaxID=1908690 RepID=A0A225E1R6_9BACT|nr:ornithine cyclodeaminase family protein [Fimbriiglobus ruber]OWK42307.1 Ornithine cyclodeaminase [Fimbriiglobus ruber]
MSVLYLTEDDVRQLLTMDVALPAVESALRKVALDEAQNIPRQRCQTDQVMLHILPAAAKTLGTIGYKAYTTTRAGAQFHVTLFDPKTGDMLALIRADYLGQIRTGAATGVATKKLARPGAATVGIYGSGRQARMQLEAICKVRTIARAHVYSRDADRREAFAKEMSAKCGTEVVPVAAPEEAARGLDIVVTATSSREPVLHGEWVAAGAHVNLIGSNFLAKAEVDVELFRRAALVVADSKEQAKLEAGDFVAALKENALNWADVRDLPNVLVGRYPGRASAQDITVFKSLGLGIEDIAVAVKVYELARAGGAGVELPV